MGARVYDPYTGTFTQPDPLPGADANAYGYTPGDPVNLTDLSGEIFLSWTSPGSDDTV
jgi:RHS repeat-associated protein